MRIISWKVLREFGKTHADAAASLRAWRTVMEKVRFQNPAEMKAIFPKASIVGDYRTVFNIGKHRLVVDVRYDLGRVFVRGIMTHNEYDRTDVRRM